MMSRGVRTTVNGKTTADRYSVFVHGSFLLSEVRDGIGMG
jgi:hypothetical protein